MLAGLQQIPGELYEAAELDRASRWQQFRHVTLPGIRGMLFGVLLVLPVPIVFVFFQRWFVQGVASSAVKG